MRRDRSRAPQYRGPVDTTSPRGVATCPTCGKLCYLSRGLARRAGRVVHPGERLNEYRCGAYWHYGHLPAAVRAGVQSRGKPGDRIHNSTEDHVTDDYVPFRPGDPDTTEHTGECAATTEGLRCTRSAHTDRFHALGAGGIPAAGDFPGVIVATWRTGPAGVTDLRWLR